MEVPNERTDEVWMWMLRTSTTRDIKQSNLRGVVAVGVTEHKCWRYSSKPSAIPRGSILPSVPARGSSRCSVVTAPRLTPSTACGPQLMIVAAPHLARQPSSRSKASCQFTGRAARNIRRATWNFGITSGPSTVRALALTRSPSSRRHSPCATSTPPNVPRPMLMRVSCRVAVHTVLATEELACARGARAVDGLREGHISERTVARVSGALATLVQFLCCPHEPALCDREPTKDVSYGVWKASVGHDPGTSGHVRAQDVRYSQELETFQHVSFMFQHVPPLPRPRPPRLRSMLAGLIF